MTPNAVPVEIQIVAVGNAETVNRINQVSNAAKHAGSEGFGALEHVLIRMSGGNRELLMGLRGIKQLMDGSTASAAEFSKAIQATLAGVGIGIAAVAIVKALEGIGEAGKKAFEDIGESSHGFFGDLLAGIGVIDTLNGQLEKTADVTKRINDNFQRQKVLMEAARADSKGTTPAEREDRTFKHLELVRDETLKRFEERGKDLEDLKKSIGAATNIGDVYQKAGITPPTENVDRSLATKGLTLSPVAFFYEREKVKEDLRKALDKEIEANTEMEHQYDRQSGVTLKKENQKVIDTQQADYWRGLNEKSFSARLSGKPDMLSDFLLHSSNATVGSVLEKTGATNPYGQTPEAAAKLLEPLFRGLDQQANRLREDALHPKVAGLAVAGTSEAWRQTVEYKTQNQGNSVEERQLTQQQIQTQLLQQLTQLLSNLTTHGGY